MAETKKDEQKPAAKQAAGLPRAVILERDDLRDADRVDGATYVDRERFDRVARAGGFGSAGDLPSDAALDLSGLKPKQREEVEAILAEK
jgi:hypothetical protein